MFVCPSGRHRFFFRTSTCLLLLDVAYLYSNTEKKPGPIRFLGRPSRNDFFACAEWCAAFGAFPSGGWGGAGDGVSSAAEVVAAFVAVGSVAGDRLVGDPGPAEEEIEADENFDQSADRPGEKR